MIIPGALLLSKNAQKVAIFINGKNSIKSKYIQWLIFVFLNQKMVSKWSHYGINIQTLLKEVLDQEFAYISPEIMIDCIEDLCTIQS